MDSNLDDDILSSLQNFDEIRQVISELDKPLSERLEILEKQLAIGDPNLTPGIIESAYSYNSFSENAREILSKKYQWLKIIELLRNILVLVPILLTWFALSQASLTYQHVIRTNPELVKVPFLLQWEEAFYGYLPTVLGTNLTFSYIARMDAILILIVILLTFSVILFSNRVNDKIDNKINQISSDVSHFLWNVKRLIIQQTQAHLDTSEKRSLELLKSITSFVKTFQDHSNELERMIAGEQKHLAEMTSIRNEEYQNLTKVTADLKNSVVAFAEKEDASSKTMAEIHNVFSSFNKESTEFSDVQKRLLLLIENNSLLYQDFGRIINVMDKNQREYVQSLVTHSTDTIQKINELVAVVNNLNASSRNLAQEQADTRNSIDDQNRNNEKTHTYLETFNSSSQEFVATNNNLITINRQLAESNNSTNQSINGFRTILTTLKESVDQLSSASKTVDGSLTKAESQISDLAVPIISIPNYLSQVTTETKQVNLISQTIIKEIESLRNEISLLHMAIKSTSDNAQKDEKKPSFFKGLRF